MASSVVLYNLDEERHAMGAEGGPSLTDRPRVGPGLGKPRGVRRYTLRAAAVMVLIGTGMVGALGYLVGGPGEPAPTLTEMANPEDPFAIGTMTTPGGVYVGYPLADYDAQHRDRYDERALADAVLAWHDDHPTARILDIRAQHAPDGTLIGYLVVLDTDLS